MHTKFLINRGFFFCKKMLYRIFPKLIQYYNIKFPSRIRNIIINISINIIGKSEHELLVTLRS